MSSNVIILIPLSFFFMKNNFDKHRDVWGPLFSFQMYDWSQLVFSPASIMIQNDQLVLKQSGEYPIPLNKPGSGAHFSKNGIILNSMKELPENYVRVKYFDYAAREYEMATHEFKKYIIKEAFEIIGNYVTKDCAILDCACGPGYESILLTSLVPDGEVVALDFSTEMIRLAYENAKDNWLTNISFFQADIQKLPDPLHDVFDIVFCQLSCSFFEEMERVANSFYSALLDYGIVFLIEPYPNIPNSASTKSAKAANPYFERLYSLEEFKSIFIAAGFNEYFWKEILPGIGMSIIIKR